MNILTTKKFKKRTHSAVAVNYQPTTIEQRVKATNQVELPLRRARLSPNKKTALPPPSTAAGCVDQWKQQRLSRDDNSSKERDNHWIVRAWSHPHPCLSKSWSFQIPFKSARRILFCESPLYWISIDGLTEYLMVSKLTQQQKYRSNEKYLRSPRHRQCNCGPKRSIWLIVLIKS